MNAYGADQFKHVHESLSLYKVYDKESSFYIDVSMPCEFIDVQKTDPEKLKKYVSEITKHTTKNITDTRMIVGCIVEPEYTTTINGKLLDDKAKYCHASLLCGHVDVLSLGVWYKSDPNSMYWELIPGTSHVDKEFLWSIGFGKYFGYYFDLLHKISEGV
ncbi:hypothetical protein MM5_184 [Morganella phage vB_Mm5]